MMSEIHCERHSDAVTLRAWAQRGGMRCMAHEAVTRVSALRPASYEM